MDVLAEEERLLPHLHLSVQHGDDLILKRMKRRHLARDVERFCAEARRRRPDVVFGADVIAGFPTETEIAHVASLNLLTAANITHLHVFPYSPRPGTPAAAMPQLDPAIIKDRAGALRQLGIKQLDRFLDQSIGAPDELLVESGNRGHGRHFSKIRLDGDYVSAGQVVSVVIIGREGDWLIGRKQEQSA